MLAERSIKNTIRYFSASVNILVCGVIRSVFSRSFIPPIEVAFGEAARLLPPGNGVEILLPLFGTCESVVSSSISKQESLMPDSARDDIGLNIWSRIQVSWIDRENRNGSFMSRTQVLASSTIILQ
jgi:hypothetical protein